MLDGLLGRGFAGKCKSLIKLTKSRIDVIRRKRRATEKFLKKDIADLLANGLDINAYGRAEGLMVELTLSSCYDFIERSCEFVLKHLSVMQKLSGCPEECREAVSSLMFAAARFSDLPELRDLRQIFQERYGNSLECYVNQQFAANLNLKSSTLEKRVCLMQEIASEFSIKWDSKAFELRMSKSYAFEQGHNTCMSNHLTDYSKPSHGNDATPKGVKYDVLLEKSPDHLNDEHRFQNGKEAVVLNRDDHDLHSRSKLSGSGFKLLNGREVLLKEDDHDNLPNGRQEVTAKTSDKGYWKEGSMPKPIERSSQEKTVEQFEGGSMLHDRRGNTTPLRESRDTVAARKPPSHAKLLSKSNLNEPFDINHVGLPDTDDCERKVRKVTAKKSDRGYWKEGSMLKPIGHSSQEKTVEQFEGGSKLHDSWGNTIPPRESQDTATARKPPSHAGLRLKSNVNEPFDVNHVGLPDTDNCERKVQKDETPRLNPYYNNAIPPPYVKPNSKQKNSTHTANVVSSHIDGDDISTYPSVHEKTQAASTSERIQLGLDNSDYNWQASRHVRPSKQSHEKEFSIHEDATEFPVLKPKSMRRKHSKSQSSHNDASNEDTGVVRKLRSRRRDDSRRGLQILFDDEQYQNDEEERIIDKLLIHYSKKPAIPMPEKARRKSKSRHAHLMDNSAWESLKNGSGDGPDETPEMVTLPPRSVSLPREQTGGVEVKKVFTRAASFQPDGSNEARHVHPKLPDYDDLAARFAALRGR